MAAANVRSEITKSLNDAISDEKSVKEIIADVKEIVIKTGVSEHDVVVLVRSSFNISERGDLATTQANFWINLNKFISQRFMSEHLCTSLGIPGL